MSDVHLFKNTFPIGQTKTFSQWAIPTEQPTQEQEREAVTPVAEHDQLQSMPASGTALTSLSIGPPQVLKVATNQQVTQAVEEAIANSFKRVPSRLFEDRHELNQRLQSSSPELSTQKHPVLYDGSDVVIIAFEGTGAFDPRQAPIMQEVADKLYQQGLTLKDSDTHMTSKVADSLARIKGKDSMWSGLAHGPLTTLLEHPELQQNSQWLSFASEELEILATPDSYKQTSIMDIVSESIDSYNGNTPGINQALKAVKSIQEQARAQGKQPRFMIVTHSSGGRSAVKFLELAKEIKDDKNQSLNFPFVMTIDPVREAHEAIFEAGRELLNKSTEHKMNQLRSWFEWAGAQQKKVYPPLVRSRSQPESLYKTGNTGKFINFYQKRDTEGLKMNPKFGIQGSPIKGAENNEIYNVGSAGHGEIAYHQKVTTAFINGLQEIIKTP